MKPRGLRRRHAAGIACLRSIRPCLHGRFFPAVIAGSLLGLLGISVGAAAELPLVSFRGSLTLPDRAVDADGREVVVTGLSGIAWLGEDRYVAVMDNSRHLLLLRVRLSQTGVPLEAADLRVVTLGEAHDYEDVVVCPPAVASAWRPRAADPLPGSSGTTAGGGGDGGRATGCVLVCEEDTPAIRGVALADGALIGSIPLPDNLRSRRPNRGLEALGLEPGGKWLWTANEEALAGDGPASAQGGGTVVRLTRLPLGVAGRDGEERPFQAAYRVDAVHSHVALLPGAPLSGLVAIVPVGSGRLLALERSGAAGLPPFHSRLYLVDTAAAADVAAVARDLAARAELLVAKQPLWGESLGINLEGLCAGPALVSGGTALVGIADNGGLGTPNQIVGLALESALLPVDPWVLGAIVAAVAAALVVGRLTSP